MVRFPFLQNRNADDTQLYLSFTPCEWGDALERVKECVKEIKAWLVSNILQLNGDKTQIVLVRAPRANSGVSDLVHVQIDGHPIPFSTSVKNVGVIFDNNSIWKHMLSLCVVRACFISETFPIYVVYFLTKLQINLYKPL